MRKHDVLLDIVVIMPFYRPICLNALPRQARDKRNEEKLKNKRGCCCRDQVTGKNCRPYGDTNRMVHQQVLLDYGHKGGGAGPPYHILLNGTKVHRSDPLYPKSAYSFYCCPCTSCGECEAGSCCDPLSNPNGQSIYKIAPDPTWAVHGFPANASDGYVGNPKMHELNVGALWKQIWCEKLDGDMSLARVVAWLQC